MAGRARLANEARSAARAAVLLTAFRLLLAPVRGALYLVVILTSTVFAIATGIVGAAVTVLGIMASPIMVKAGYDGKLSSGTITAGGTLGILIPPSVMLVVMGRARLAVQDVTRRSPAPRGAQPSLGRDRQGQTGR
jgi:TRAP-type mannitol/chloroaromatic compound transport system permease large subunit